MAELADLLGLQLEDSSQKSERGSLLGVRQAVLELATDLERVEGADINFSSWQKEAANSGCVCKASVVATRGSELLMLTLEMISLRPLFVWHRALCRIQASGYACLL